MESMSEGAEQVKFCSTCSLFKPASDFYFQRGKPHGYCKECAKAKSKKRYREDPIAFGEVIKRRKYQRRLDMIAAYGGKCKCCSISEPRLLTLDHVNGGGKEHQRLIGNADAILRQLERIGWPQDDYQLLCWNCNCGRSRTKSGLCPHIDSLMPSSELAPDATVPPTTKICPLCGQEKLIADGFFAHPSGASSYCKQCAIAWRRERRRQLRAGLAFPRSAPSGLNFFKYCSLCGLWKQKADFNRNGNKDAGPHKLQGWCRNCAKSKSEERRERNRELSRLRDQRLRGEVIQSYGSACVLCGEKEWGFLTIDHINGGGSRERKTTGLKGGFYRRLRREGFPRDRYRLLCYNCNCSRAFCPE